MELRQRLRAVWSALSGGAGGSWLVPWHLRREDRGTPAVTPQTALALAATYRACSLLSDAASGSPCYLYARPQNGGRVIDETSAAARALATLSHADCELYAWSCALTGAGFLRIHRDGTGAPFELRAIAPWRVVLEVEDVTNALWYRVQADPTTGEGEVLLPEKDMVHAKFRNTSSRLVGVPPVTSCSPAFGLALQSRDVQRALFSNLATPGGILVAPGKIDKLVAQQLQSEWAANYRQGGLGRIAVLSNGLDYKPITFKAADQQLLEQVQASTVDIALAYGLPPSFLSDGAHMTYASASEATRALYALALRGYCVRLADALAQKLLSRDDRASGAGVEFDLSGMLVLPGTEMADFLSKLANSGLMTANEIRTQFLSLPHVAGGNVLRAPSSSVPADQLVGGAKSWESGRQYEAGTFVAHEHGLWVRARGGEDDEPTDYSTSWSCIVPGIRAMYHDASGDLLVEATDGTSKRWKAMQ